MVPDLLRTAEFLRSLFDLDFPASLPAAEVGVTEVFRALTSPAVEPSGGGGKEGTNGAHGVEHYTHEIE